MKSLRYVLSSLVAGLLLTLTLSTSVSWAEQPFHEVTLESTSSPNWSTGFWEGPAIIYIDGIKYEGDVVYTGDGDSNKNIWQGTEFKVYSFGDLGTMELSGTAKTIFAYVAPGDEHRWHRYSSHSQITGGTGAFAAAQGVFQFVGYTDWHVYPAGPPDAYAFEGTQAKIIGIQMNGQ